MQRSGLNWGAEKSENLSCADCPSSEVRDKSGVSLHKQMVEVSSSSQKRGFSELTHEGVLLEEATSSSMPEKMVDSQEYAYSSGSLLTLHPWLFRKDNFQVDMKWGSKLPIRYLEMDENANGVQPQVTHINASSEGHSWSRRKFMRNLRSRHAKTYSKKPLDSVDSCLIPTLYEDDAETEEFGYSSVPAQSLLMRPFYISDGSQIISKMDFNLDFCSENRLQSECNGSNIAKFMTGFTPLHECSKPKRKTKQRLQEGLGTSISRQTGNAVSLPGSSDGLLLFLMGCTVGIVLTMISKKGEVEKLNAMLRQSENLVKDLEEELEMKDSVTVKELVNESFENQGCVETSSDMQEPNNLTSNQLFELHSTEQEYGNNHSGKPEEKSVPLSTIEAELEAELERLELNMNVSSLADSTFLLDDLDDDFIAYVAKGELREDKINGGDESRSVSCENSKQSSAIHTPPANYSVSPKELCLRLYELNQCRLEERIKELEDALYHRQNYLHVEEIKRPVCISSSDISSSANQGSPVVREIAESSVSQPLCINLSGDALDAYNEAYDEFIRITQIEGSSVSVANAGEQIPYYEFCDSDGSLPWGIESESEKHVETLPEYNLCVANDPCKEMPAHSSYKVSEAHEENNNVEESDDEEGRMLIQQIVERTKKGSPVVLDVQKLLLCIDNN